MILAVDFDGTICHGQYPSIDGLQPGAVDVINRLYDQGHYIIIYTCRSGDQLVTAVNWMLEHGIKFHRVNDNHPDQIRMYNNNSRKVYAHMYIDDKNLGGFPGWFDAYEEVKRIDELWKSKIKQS